MKITDNMALRQTQAARRKTGVSGAGATSFEGFLEAASSGGVSDAAPVSEAAGVGGIDGVLALQSVSEEEVRRKATVRHGNDMLDTLENLRRSLLAGLVPAAVIMELGNRLARQREQINDPVLLEIMDDIELRVAVEKAKLEMALRDQGVGGQGLGMA